MDNIKPYITGIVTGYDILKSARCPIGQGADFLLPPDASLSEVILSNDANKQHTSFRYTVSKHLENLLQHYYMPKNQRLILVLHIFGQEGHIDEVEPFGQYPTELACHILNDLLLNAR